MRVSYYFFILVFLVVSFSETQAEAASLWIKNVTVVSPERSKPLTNVNVLIQEGKITAITKRPSSPQPGDREVDGTGRFLIPGLIDSHVHLAKVPGMNGGHKKATRSW